MPADVDVAVLGSGFAGSLIALIARRLGRSVALLERGQHPRFAIGESSTPLANLLWEELATRYELPRLLPFSKWGTWRRAYPEVHCGLKRGFSFYHHRFGIPFSEDPIDRSNQLLVAASPRDEIADTHWYRPDFDAFLAREAQTSGADFIDQLEIQEIAPEPAGLRISGVRRGVPVEIKARFVLDATGPRGCLHRALQLPEVPFEKLPRTQALFSHFQQVRRWDELHPAAGAPYPPDDAALHHVFPGGWLWVLRFNNGITSAGAAVTHGLAEALQLAEGAPAWSRLLEKLPSVREQFAGAEPTVPFVHQPSLSFLSGYIVGPGWGLLPSAAGFVDPLLSTGIPLTLLGITRLARILENSWSQADFSEALFDYSMRTTMELTTTARLIAALYSVMDDPPVFNALSLLYFAAASFTEAARRLGHPELAGEAFLLSDHPQFGARLRYCVDRALQPLDETGRADLLARIQQTLEPVDVAGLGDLQRRNWYPVLAGDIRSAAPKLNASPEEISAMLTRCGF